MKELLPMQKRQKKTKEPAKMALIKVAYLKTMRTLKAYVKGLDGKVKSYKCGAEIMPGLVIVMINLPEQKIRVKSLYGESEWIATKKREVNNV
jgi:hypothetical protein